MSLGLLVRSKNNDLGIGKIISLDSSNATVEYFCSIGQRLTETIPIASIGRIKLERQTRCYLYQEGKKSWQIGRIYAWDEDKEEYQIDLPDSKMTFAPESQIYVRCNRTLEDPIDLLAMKGQETPYFHSQRFRFLKSLIQQRAISRGMRGLLSANIEYHPHQVEVIRRVLEDPIQRYLLADEVGLGKTIEAGVILRQFLLDEPTEKALIIVPPSLLDQWQQELEDKFYLSQFPDRVTFLSTQDWANLENNNTNYNFLIIDEAHHIAEMSASGDPLKRRCFNTCRKLAHKCKNLLLLSATPVLNHEEDFLTMLHFLDPINYQLDDLEGFRERVRIRQDIGRVLSNLKEGIKPFVLKKSIQDLRRLFAEDNTLLSLLDQLETQQDPEEINKEISAIRSYISDTYRLHRRMLRNRRTQIEDVIFDRNALPKFEYNLDQLSYPLYELLDEWRITAPDKSNYQSLFILLFRASNTWLGLLKQVIEFRLKRVTNNFLVQDFGESNCQMLKDTPYFEGEETILNSILDLLNLPSSDNTQLKLLKIVILHHLADVLKLQSYQNNLQDLEERIKQRITRPFAEDKFPKLIIFTSFTETAKAIVDYLAGVFDNKTLVSYRRDYDKKTIENNLNQFKNNPQCFLLVVDPSGEEGRNLQFVDGLIHFDLPFSPNKLEQRLGRVDRIGGKQKINSWLLAGIELPNSLHDFWYQVLDQGFNIFKQSIASLQFYVDNKMTQIERDLFRFDPHRSQEIIELIKQEIEDEDRKNNEQNYLDEIETYSEVGRDYFQVLEDYDQEHQKIEQATEGWLVGALRFSRSYDDNLKDVRKYQPKEGTLIPLKDLKTYFATKMRHQGVYNRRLANKYSGVHLYRIGEELIETLADYLNWDERGKAFAMWRQEESWTSSIGGEWLGFRFDYLIEIDWQKIKSVLENFPLSGLNEKALKRQGDTLFPPLLKTIFLDKDYQRVEDESLLKILKRSYIRQGKENKDYNIAKERLSILDQFIEPSQWESFCLEMRQISETILRTSSDFLKYSNRHKKTAKVKLENRLHQLELRYQRFSKDPQLKQEIELETALSKAFLKEITHPSFRLDAVGFIIVSGLTPATNTP